MPLSFFSCFFARGGVGCAFQALIGKRVGHVACGGFHSAAILESGELYTWGGGEHGQVRCAAMVFFFFSLSFSVRPRPCCSSFPFISGFW